MYDSRKEPTAAEIKAEKEERYQHSLAHSIEKARASKVRTQAMKRNVQFDKLEKIYTAINILAAELIKSRKHLQR